MNYLKKTLMNKSDDDLKKIQEQRTKRTKLINNCFLIREDKKARAIKLYEEDRKFVKELLLP